VQKRNEAFISLSHRFRGNPPVSKIADQHIFAARIYPQTFHAFSAFRFLNQLLPLFFKSQLILFQK